LQCRRQQVPPVNKCKFLTLIFIFVVCRVVFVCFWSLLFISLLYGSINIESIETTIGRLPDALKSY